MRHDSYLPSSPATLQALDRMEYAMVNAVAPPDVRIVGPHFIVSPHSPSVPGYTYVENSKSQCKGQATSGDRLCRGVPECQGGVSHKHEGCCQDCDPSA